VPKKNKDKKPKKKKKKAKLSASTADPFVLYEESVQAADFEVAFLERRFKRWTGRRALTLREDFCGSGLLSRTWVESHPERSAVGLDIDDTVLASGQERHVADLPEEDRSRLRLIHHNVLDPHEAKHDLICAYNYSYFTFKDRPTLGRYFKNAREALVEDGLFVLDCLGGWETRTHSEERRRYKGFIYTWEQARFNPLNADFRAHIHFEFKDKSALKEAFTYDWRLWQPVELVELLKEAGFPRVDIFWETEDENGEPSGQYRRRVAVEDDPSWNCYLIARTTEEKAKKAKKR
jgi:SAM-dependent methyltransferase